MIDSHTYVCFGEVLWDVFPEYKAIGGAPLNVALRLNSLAKDASIISAVGKDDLGDQLIQYLDANSLSNKLVQQSTDYATGAVKVILDSQGSASYDIEYPKAWDFIASNPINEKVVQSAKVFIFGSLVARSDTSRSTLFSLLEKAQFKVFDMNLRPPHYSFDLLEELMLRADFLKMNDEELDLVCENLKIAQGGMKDRLTEISKRYSLPEVCVTRGASGAMLMVDDKFYEHQGYRVKVMDTVGAGDSFLASLIYQLQTNIQPVDALDFACAVGAMVASMKGANPSISKEQIQQFIEKHSR